jgi:putative ABC transport system permease protein
LCDRLHLNNCPPVPKLAARQPDASTRSLATPFPDLAELAGRDKPADGERSDEPIIDLLAATAGGAPNVVTLRVSRVEVQTLKELDDNYVGMNIGLAQNLIYGRGEHKASGIVIQLKRTEDMERARKRLLALFNGYGLDLEVRDFTELNPQYNQIIGMFRSIFAFISAIIAMVVLFTVTNAMGMSVVERTGEIGTSRAMGIRRQGIRKQFLAEGSLLGIMGATVGVALAYLIAFAINHSNLTWSPPGQVARAPLLLYLVGAEWLIAVSWFGLLVVSAMAALVPANRAARMVVVDALRHV